MKKLLKITLTLLIAVAMTGVTSCSKDGDEPDHRLEVLPSEIQGTWGLIAFGNFHEFDFHGDNYSYTIMNVNSKKIEHHEYGTFQIHQDYIYFNPTLT